MAQKLRCAPKKLEDESVLEKRPALLRIIAAKTG
jgi:hypothetical protein